ncbi:hypothetical protein L1887_55965 [Cichorium endivia]|nr:hypothetical protein L1887_55965 [Cichorium endivia]
MGTPSRGYAGDARALVPLYAPTIEPGNAVGECQADDNVPAMTADQAGHPRLESAAAEAHDADVKPILCLSHAGSLCSRRILPPLRVRREPRSKMGSCSRADGCSEPKGRGGPN